MKFMQIAPLAGLFALASLPAMAEVQATAAGTFRTADRDEAGTADLTEGPGGVLLRIEVEGLEPGWHGIHFHAVGDCSDEGFKKSGAHTHHEAEKPPHGLLNPEGPDDGDLPNIYANENGVAKAELYSSFVTLTGAEGRANLLDEDGAAIVIHEGQDDHMSQPIGGAGDRVACAVIEKAE